MNQIVKILNGIDINELQKELLDKTNRSRNSKIFNDAFKKFSKKLDTKNIIYDVWNNTIIPNSPLAYGKKWEDLMISLNKILKVIYPNISTLKTILAQLREPLKDKSFDPEIISKSYELMGQSKLEYKIGRDEYKNEVKKRNFNIGSLPVIHIEKVVMNISHWAKSDNRFDNLIAAALATGLRTIEILKVSDVGESKMNDHIHIKGLSKDDRRVNETFERRLIGLNSKEAVDLITKIRSKFDTTGDNSAITARFARRLNDRFKKRIEECIGDKDEKYQDYIKKMTIHKSRYIYGGILYKLYGGKVPMETFIQEQLNHLSGDSTKSYLSVNLEFYNKNQSDEKVDEIKKDIDISKYANPRNRNQPQKDKVIKVIEYVKELKKLKLPIVQRKVREDLKYSTLVMVFAWKELRKQNII